MSENAAAVYVDPSTLVPWDKNPRNNAEAIKQVAKSIERFGFASPIVARQADGRIIAGHTRHAAALRLGLEDVPVRFLDIDEQKASALALADNKIGEIATWNDDTLGEILAELEQDGFDLDGLGWDEDELSGLLDWGKPEEPEPETDDRDFDSLPEDVPAITQLGDVVELGKHVLHCGDCLEVMRGMPENSIDAIVCDPPYGIGFMGKGWDVAVPGEDWARECLRVLKPGGHLIAFAATRTVHRLTVAIEDAGFEIRDQIGWLQWQGFPKSLDCSKAIDALHGAEREVTARLGRPGFKTAAEGYRDNKKWSGERRDQPATPDARRFEGYGTALKPAFEPAVLARKPLSGTVAANCLEWGTGGLNIDGCRMAYGDPAWPGPSEELESRKVKASSSRGVSFSGSVDGSLRQSWKYDGTKGRWPANIYACPKPSRAERERGCDHLPGRTGAEAVERKEGTAGLDNPRAGAGRTADQVKNYHPTVKPSRLMRWLIRLVSPPALDGVPPVVLETFGGSGTTMVAAELEGVRCIGIEMEPSYCDIIRARLTDAIGGQDGTTD